MEGIAFVQMVLNSDPLQSDIQPRFDLHSFTFSSLALDTHYWPITDFGVLNIQLGSLRLKRGLSSLP